MPWRSPRANLGRTRWRAPRGRRHGGSLPGPGHGTRSGRRDQGPPRRAVADTDRLQRFELEARAVAALNHPDILTVHDVGTHDGTPYVVTELLDGETLRAILARRSPHPAPVLACAVQAARGLAAAHRKGIVHRDLKPENLFLTTDGRRQDPRLRPRQARRPRRVDCEEATAAQLHAARRADGDGRYLSPEQVQALAVDARWDLFSFGVVLYELLARKHPSGATRSLRR